MINKNFKKFIIILNNIFDTITKSVIKSLYNSKIARLATVDPENNQPYVVPVVFVFDGNNIFILMDEKPKTVNLCNFVI